MLAIFQILFSILYRLSFNYIFALKDNQFTEKKV